ncbi:uncharacterized protein LOC112541590 [Python bivittatus]|uniref:Uncharacterized protein LOC112541590 n=1 Tax=Python bivittatus TaxID=176946 RepID=A0A9F5ILT2_PYTBI|nr:uncharacterized protein LOC112541590 [Python bivittatus]
MLEADNHFNDSGKGINSYSTGESNAESRSRGGGRRRRRRRRRRKSGEEGVRGAAGAPAELKLSAKRRGGRPPRSAGWGSLGANLPGGKRARFCSGDGGAPQLGSLGARVRGAQSEVPGRKGSGARAAGVARLRRPGRGDAPVRARRLARPPGAWPSYGGGGRDRGSAALLRRILNSVEPRKFQGFDPFLTAHSTCCIVASL